MDYYKLLQIDPSAEREMIELAYKRMAKKYHPDICKTENSIEMMRQLNNAYSILKDPALRRQYDLQRTFQNRDFVKVNPYVNKGQNLERILKATTCLANYLDAIKQKAYTLAYSFVNSGQKEIMSFDVFRNWQHWISKVYSIVDYKTSISGYGENITINNKAYKFVITFEVEVLEFNQVMEHFEKDRFVKQVIFELDNPYIFLDQTEVSESIQRYEKLAKLKVGNWQKNRIKLKIYSGKTVGLFFDQLEFEIERYARYSTPFTLVFLYINTYNSSDMSPILGNIQTVIQKNIRKLDAFILMNKKVFLIMLPGTKLYEGSQFAEKICDIAVNNSVSSKAHFTIKRTVIENDAIHLEQIKESIQTELELITQSEVSCE